MKVRLLIIFICFASVSFAQTQNEKQLFSYVNSERTREGLQPLQWDDHLYFVALEHSRDMASANRLSHTGSDRTDPEKRVLKAGIYASGVAENVARDLNVVSAHTSLMSSIYHRQNIMNPQFERVGIGIVRNAESLYITELFTAPLPDFTIAEARETLLKAIGQFRSARKLPPAYVLDELNNAAQLNAEDHARENSLDSRIPISGMAAQLHGALHINIYTSGDLSVIPAQLNQILTIRVLTIGVGAKRTRGKLCDLGCYVVTLISE